jgi:hypothetical protein
MDDAHGFQDARVALRVWRMASEFFEKYLRQKAEHENEAAKL